MLRAAVIGLGVGEKHIAGYEQDLRCRVVALCDCDPDKLAEVAARNPGRRTTTNPDDVLFDQDIDVVSIASYDDAHHQQIMKAISTGKHIFVEKPLCLLDNELDEIRNALNNNHDIRLGSNLILRRAPRFINLRRRVSSGEFGQPYYLEGDYNYGRLHKITEGWRGQRPFYSVIHGGAIHMIDLLLWLTGVRPVEAQAYGNAICSRGSQFRFNDLVVAILRFENGMVAKVSANYGCVFPHFHNLALYGTKASFIHGRDGAVVYASRDPAAEPERIDDPYPGGAKGDLIPSYVRSILDGERAEIEAHEILDVMAVSLAIETAAKTGRPTQVDYGANGLEANDLGH